MLTEKQKEMLFFVHDWIGAKGDAPTYDEIKDGLGRSKTAVRWLLLGLEERGFIVRPERHARALRVLRLPDSAGAVVVPLMGEIAWGTPVTAIRMQLGTLAYPAVFLGSGEHFALEVRGDSMIDAGILENDTVILRKQDDAETGDIVLAVIDGEEAALKRIRKGEGSIALEAANAGYRTRILKPSRVRVQGKLVSLSRRY
jgi:repressor LexA